MPSPYPVQEPDLKPANKSAAGRVFLPLIFVLLAGLLVYQHVTRTTLANQTRQMGEKIEQMREQNRDRERLLKEMLENHRMVQMVLERVQAGISRQRASGGLGEDDAKALQEQMAKLAEQIKSTGEDDASAPQPAGPRQTQAAAMTLTRQIDPRLRGTGARALGFIGGESSEARLLEMLKQPQPDELRYQICEALLDIGSDSSRAAVLAQFEQSTPVLQVELSQMLSHRMHPTMLAPIARILVKQQGHDERSSQIRHNLVRALRRLRDPRAVPALARALQMEIDEEWRLNETVDALSECAVADQTPQIGQCLSYLLSASRDSKEFIEPAERVLEWMADHRDLRATPFVVPALLSWHDDIREGAREVLAELRDPAAARGIVEAWKNGNEDARRDLVELLEEGYPGVRFDGDNRKVTLIDDDELEKLLQRRTQRMQDAEERKKRLQEPLDVF